MGNVAKVYTQLSLAVKFDTVLLPFDAVTLLRILEDSGYIILSDKLEKLVVPLGVRLDLKGVIARRGDAQIRLESDRQILGVHTPDTTMLQEEFELIESLVKKEFDLDIPTLARYYEFIAGYTVRADNNPLTMWRDHFEDTSLVKKFSKIMGTQVSPFGLRIAPSGADPNQNEFFDITIGPQVPSATSHHRVQVIYRSERNKTYEFVRKFEDLAESLLSAIEEG